MSYLIGCDIGTTSVKSIAFKINGEVIASFSEGYDMIHPAPNHTEQNPDLILNAVISTIRQICRLPGLAGIPEAISFSSAMHSLMLLDKHNERLTDLIIWADARSSALADEMRNSATGFEFYQRTGTPIHAMTPLSKLMWIKANNPTLYSSAEKFIGIKEYIIFKLTGQLLSDESIASATGLFNLRQRCWDKEILSYLGLPLKKLPDTADVTTQIPLPAGNLLALPADVPLVLGGSDGCLANLGSGAFYQGSMAATIGTSAAVRSCYDHVMLDDRMRTFCYIMDERHYISGGASNNGAVVFQWLKDQFFTGLSFGKVIEIAGEAEAGANGLCFLPFLLGERAPLWNAGATGGFLGLTLGHEKKHMVRAVMEGIIFNLYSVAKLVMDPSVTRGVYANGGFAKSDLWVRMVADIFGIPVWLNNTADAAAAGAALIGMRSLSAIDDYGSCKGFFSISREILPDPLLHEKYSESFETFHRFTSILYPER